MGAEKGAVEVYVDDFAPLRGGGAEAGVAAYYAGEAEEHGDSWVGG